jgi:Helix-turn-helix domain
VNEIEDPVYPVREACVMLGGISPWTLASWFSRGIARRTKVGRRTMVRRSEIMRLIKDQPSKNHGDDEQY